MGLVFYTHSACLFVLYKGSPFLTDTKRSVRCLSLGMHEELLLDTPLDLLEPKRSKYDMRKFCSDTCLFLVEHFQRSAWLEVSSGVKQGKY